jgi:hypothetical protein
MRRGAELLPSEQLGVPSLRTAAQAIDRQHTIDDFRLLARRAGALSARQDSQLYSAVPEGVLANHIRLHGIEPGRRYRSGARVPMESRVDGGGNPLLRLAEPVALEPLQRASASFTMTLPKAAGGHDWLLLRIVQSTDGAIDGGYTIAVRLGASTESENGDSNTAAKQIYLNKGDKIMVEKPESPSKHQELMRRSTRHAKF